MSRVISLVVIVAALWGSVSPVSAQSTPPPTPPPLLGPVLTFTANPAAIVSGETATLTWTGARLETCTASGDWSGNKPASGSQLVTPPTTKSYTLICVDPGGIFEISKTVTVTVTPAPAFDFTLAHDGNKSAEQGSTVTQIITITKTAGTAAPVALSVSGLPSGVIEALSPVSCTPNPTCTSTLTLNVAPATAAGIYTISVQGNAKTTSFALTVAQPADTQAPTTPANLTASAVSSSSVNLSWNVSTDNVEVVGYRIYRCQGNQCTPGTQIATSAGINYTNTNLTGNTAYTYAVAAYDAAGNVSVKSNSASITTPIPPDTIAPSISAVTVSNLTASSVHISWITDELSTSQVEYGLTPQYGFSTTEQPTFLATHTQVISGLTASTTYHYRVVSKDAAGNMSRTSDDTFTTAVVVPPADTTAPVISNIQVINLAATAATLTWTTDESADSTVFYGTASTTLTSSLLDSVLIINHTASLTNLNGGTQYFYTVASKDTAGNTDTSKVFSFTTLAVQNPGGGGSSGGGGGGSSNGGGGGSPSTGSGSSSGGGGYIPSPVQPIIPPVSVITQTVPASISIPATQPKKELKSVSKTAARGARGEYVTDIQHILIALGLLGADNATGFYGSLTEQAVQKFQAQNGIVSSGAPNSTGYGAVGPKTLVKLNQYTSTVAPKKEPAAVIKRTLYLGMRGEDVKFLQQFLIKAGFLETGNDTGYMGSLTRGAVIKFQEAHIEDILVPNGLTKGTGVVGPATYSKMAQLI